MLAPTIAVRSVTRLREILTLFPPCHRWRNVFPSCTKSTKSYENRLCLLCFFAAFRLLRNLCSPRKITMRNTIVLVVLAAFVGFASSSFAQTAQPTDDTQFWNDTQVAIKLAKDKKKRELVSLVFGGTLRVGRNITHLVDERAAVNIEFN